VGTARGDHLRRAIADPNWGKGASWGRAYGTAQTTANGNTVTVYGVQIPIQPDSGVGTAPSTLHGAALDAEVCATKVPISDTSQADFNLHGATKHTSHPLKAPAFPETAQKVPLGTCVRGWVSFETDLSIEHLAGAQYTDRSVVPPGTLFWEWREPA
jgi:hypothetical protein